MWTASPTAVHTLLLGLLRLKQGQQRAAKAAGKRQQQQQQAGFTSGTAALENPGAAGSAAAAAVATPAGVTSLSAQTIDELRLLKAAMLWIQSKPNGLQQYQVAGLITALAELLPDVPAAAPQQQQQQRQSVPLPPQQAQQQQQQPVPLPQQQQPVSLPTQQQQQQQPVSLPPQQQQQQGSKFVSTQKQLLVLLQEVVPVWAADVHLLGQSVGKGRPARFFKLKWAQLVAKCDMAEQPGTQSKQ
jgi:transcription initiation factor TFIID subunit 12